ncbi:MAG: hypothetical protein EOO41_04645 [Methanobacteriota archaeon]|nr:MAG: hypothetical protein EOO41_04645 [Euryarchaeota archaeon]
MYIAYLVRAPASHGWLRTQSVDMDAGANSLNLRGVSVPFPWTPYPLQLTFMSSMISALQSAENALLESPTGTGKVRTAAALLHRAQARGERAGLAKHKTRTRARAHTRLHTLLPIPGARTRPRTYARGCRP